MKMRNRVLTRKEGEERGRKPKDIRDCKTTTSLSISPYLLEQVEIECRRQYISKSSFIGALISEYFDRAKEKMPDNLKEKAKKTIDEIK